MNIVVEVTDPDEGDLIQSIELYADGEAILTDEPGATERRWEVTLTPEPGGHYYFVKLTQADGNRIYCAPVWVTIEATDEE